MCALTSYGNISDEHVSVMHLPREMHLCRSSSNFSRLPTFLKLLLQNPHVFAHLWPSTGSLAYATQDYILISKSGRSQSGFSTSDFEIRFLPQRRAPFQHLNFQKCSDTEAFCIFGHQNVLHATTAGTFEHLNFQKCSDAEVFLTFGLRNVLRATAACLLDPLEPQIIGNTVFRDSFTLSCTFIFFLMALSFLLFLY